MSIIHAPKTRRLVLLAMGFAAFGLILGCVPNKDDDDDAVSPISLANPLATPPNVVQGSNILVSVQANSTAGAIIYVRANLGPLGGSSAQTLYDNGTNGDISPADAIFSYLYTVPVDATVGAFTIVFMAGDTPGNTEEVSVDITVTANQPPLVSNVTSSLATVPPGGRVVFTADVSDPDGSISQVTADLTSIGGLVDAAFYDDGTHGDSTAGDGTYTLETTVNPATTPGAGKSILVTGVDNATATASDSTSITVSTNIAPAMTNYWVNPSVQVQRMSATFSVDVTDADGVASVTVNLFSVNGSATQAMTNTGGNTYQYTYNLPTDCPAGTWRIIMTATDGVGTTNYAPVTFISETNVPPHFLVPQANPDPAARNQNVLLSVYAADADGTVASVLINLAPLGGSTTATMYDNGTNGDDVAGDWIFSLRYTILPGQSAGTHNLTITGTDDDGVSDTDTLSMDTNTTTAPLLSNAQATPNPQEVGAQVTFTADTDATATAVTIDLSLIGGNAAEPMFDDGTHGDGGAGDDTFGYQYIIPGSVLPGTYKVYVNAVNGAAVSNTVDLSLTVQPNTAPVLSNATVTPEMEITAYPVLLTVDVADAQGMSSITADLTPVGRGAAQALYDDGTNGDASSGDGTYSISFLIPAHQTAGSSNISIQAQDTLGLQASTSASMAVVRIRMDHVGFLEDIHGTSSNDIYSVGNYDQVCHYDGTSWQLVYPGQNQSWWGVWCESATSVYVGGTNNAVAHFDGTDWSSRNITTSPDTYIVRAFWDDGQGRVYAAGGISGNQDSGSGGQTPADYDDGHLLAYYSAGSWTVLQQTVNDDDFNAIFGTRPTDIVAVGDDGYILHYDGTSWQNESVGGSDDFYGVWGFYDGANSFYWAVQGQTSGTANPIIFFYNGSNWSQVATVLPYPMCELTGIWGRTLNNQLAELYVCGTYNNGKNYATVWRSTDGQTFNQLAISSPPVGYSPDYFPYAPYRLIMTDCWIPPGQTDLWVTGHRSIQRYTASTTPPWTEFTRGTYENTRAVDVFSSSRAITWDYPRRPWSSPTAKQVSSIVHHFHGGRWHEYTDITGTIGPELETHPMLDPPSVTQPDNCPRIYAVKMFSGASTYGVGGDGHIYLWDGQTTIGHDFLSMHQYGIAQGDERQLYAIWGMSDSDFWFGGAGNRIYHYTGAGWLTPPTQNLLPGTTKVITGIWGAASNNVYAVTAQTGVGGRTANMGDVYHWDGFVWSSIANTAGLPAAATVTLGNLNAIWGASANEIYIVGDGGRAWQFDGFTWTSIASSLSPTVDLNCVFGDAGTGARYIVGDDMRIFCYYNGAWQSLRANGSGGDIYGGDSVGNFILMAGQEGLTFRLER